MGVAMRGRRWSWGLGASLGLALAGCGPGGDIDRAGKALLANDIYGCPDLSGTYAFALPGEKGASYAGSMLEEFEIEWGNRVPADQIRAVTIRRFEPGAFEFRFQVQEARVMRQLSIIREFEKPRYREWYHLSKEPQRSAFIAGSGAEAYAKRLRELGPTAEIVREVRSGTQATCRDGWLELPRRHIPHPIRLTLGEDRSIIGEARELSTYDIPIWCGDGCKDLKIPTGTYTGRLHWPRDGSLRPWRAEDMARRYEFQRPIDEIEAEQRALAETQRRSDALHFLPAETIRARLEALAPAGTVVEKVEIADGKVRIRYTAPTAEVDALLDRVEDAGGVSVTEAPQEVQRIVTSGRFHVRSVEFVLTHSPLVLRETRGTGASERASAGSSVASVEAGADRSAASEPKLLVLSVAEPQAKAARIRSPPVVSADSRAAQTPPDGMADPFAIQRRVGGLFPAGCRIVDVRYAGDLVRLTGQAEQQRCVSEGLRALDGAGSRPELESIEGEARGGYVFRISMKASSLTRR